MSAFECNVTPTRFRNEKKRNEDREPTIVDLRPFGPKAIVTFEDIPVSKIARRLIIVSNPFHEDLHVSVSRVPKPEFNVALEWTINKIPPESSKNLEVIWNPKKVVSCREIVQISDEHGNKKDIAIILKSRELKKTTSRKVAPSGFPKKLKMKTPSPPSSFARTTTISQSPSTTITKTVTTYREYQESFVVSPLRNCTNTRPFNPISVEANIFDRLDYSKCTKLMVDKENGGPSTPNATNIFDNIRFTPKTETKKTMSDLEYLTSLPTPKGSKREDFFVNETNSRRNLMTTGISPGPSSLLPSLQPAPSIRLREPSEEDEINEIELVIGEYNEILSHTRVISTTPLCTITENEHPADFQKTFAVIKSQSFVSITNDGSPARVASESMREVSTKEREKNVRQLKANQGSMPNLNEMNESVGCIEHNRYFRREVNERQNLSTESVVSNADFRETEICAQSSRYNLHELDSSSRPRKSAPKSKSPVQDKMIKTVRLNDDSPRGSHQSPTMHRIQQEPDIKRTLQPKELAMTFSPPARNKLTDEFREMQRRETFDIPTRGRQIRATTWKQQQNLQLFVVPRAPRESGVKTAPLLSQSLHSLSSSSLTSVNSTCSIPATLTNGRLYNENHINAYAKKDPFSATTTIDPFLSSTMYLDERTLDNIEKTYKKWLNALVTIPADLEADRNEKVDVGKLFNEVQSKELTLAPTKELVCSRYYTARLDSLRNSAVNYFHSFEIAGPLNKLTVVINEKNKLDINADRNIHLDLVLQRSLLELLLCYNPLWLRIGLEVVFNVQLNLTSNHDLYGMTRYIITNMFKSQYLAEKYSKFSQQKEYLDKLRKHTVKSFLFIIFFLDRAKEHRLIKQNPCLFVKKAPFKESAEILKKFASLVLANYGDIIRTLRRFDYILTHKQTVIDEFDYAFKNLAIDLRDGVRLTKVMEIILMRDDLVQRVRVPAISRLQKVHNVDLALKALEAAEYQILGNITSKDIADGHREKTLSLLWQIIYKFRAPRFNAAAITIQRFWRSKYLMVVINRRIKAKKEAKLNRAATVIQKYYRGWRLRQEIKVYREKMTTSCTVIQKHFRGLIARRRFLLKIRSVVTVQQWFRQVIIVRRSRKQFLLQKTSALTLQKWWRRHLLSEKLIASSVVIRTIKKDARIRHDSAIIIQRSLKSYLIHKKLHAIISSIVSISKKVHTENLAASKIQSLVRMRNDRKAFLKVKQSALSIQCWWRHTREGQKQLETFTVLKQSTIKIQCWYRGVLLMKKERSEFLVYRRSVITVQQIFRANLQMRKQKFEYQQLRFTTTIVQQRFRALLMMRQQRAEYQHVKQAARTIQSRFRATLSMKAQRDKFLTEKKSAITIQRKLRATLLMKQELRCFLQLKSAALTIQQVYRAQILMRVEVEKYQKLRKAAICIQQRYRANQLMKQQFVNFATVKRAALTIQQRFRAYQLMKKERNHFMQLKETTIKIQQKFRSTKLMRKLTVEFYSIQYYTIVLQQVFRAKVAMRKYRREFLTLKSSTIAIQRRFKGKLMMRRDLAQYKKTKAAIITIQRRWRATLDMKRNREEFLKVKQAATNIQRRFRSNKLCKEQRTIFVEMKKYVGVIETRYIAQQVMREARKEFLLMKQSAIIIQTRFRATLSMKLELLSYQNKRWAVVAIQKYFRGYQAMKVERKNFLEKRESALILQRHFRAQMNMKREQASFNRLKASTIAIQQRFRANQAMKTQQNEFTKLKTATVAIQRKLRATLTMRVQQQEFVTMKSSAVVIQQTWRSTIEMRKDRKVYQATKQAVLNIQMRFRANKAMKLQREQFLLQKCAAVKIQSYFRSILEMREERHSFLSMKSSAIAIQMRFRANLAMRAQREDFMRQKSAALKIQKSWRGLQVMRQTKENYQTLKSAAKVIQQRYRAKLAMKKVRAEYETKRMSALKIQQSWRATVAMRKQKIIYQQTVEHIIVIQRRFRANLLMKQVRDNFTSQKRAAFGIQRWFRSYRLMVQERNQFLLLKKTVLLMENRILANRLMQAENDKYQELRQAVIFAQKRFRSKIETKRLQRQFKETQIVVVKLQTRIRGYQARQRFREMQTPERLELRQKHKAARTIQAAWRGCKERSKKCNRCFKAIVDRLIRAKKNVNNEQTLAIKLKTSIDFLKSAYDSNQAICFLAKLEYMSRTVPWILNDDAEFVSLCCYGFMDQAIRSELDKQVIELCSCIILNLGRYKDTKENTFQEYGLRTIAQMLLRWCDKDCGIFNTLCTLVWVFAHCENKKKAIRKFMLMKDGEFIVSQIKQNVLRKENMRKNSRRPIGFQSISLIKYKKDYQMQLRHQSQSTVYSSGFITPEMLQQCREMPSLNPDYGVVKLTPYIFYSSVFAFDNVLQILDIRQP